MRTLFSLFLLCFSAQLSARDIDSARIGTLIENSRFEGDVVIAIRPDGPPRYKWVGSLPMDRRGEGDGLTWRWASVTKQIVAVLIMQQVEEGTLALDRPVGQYLPAFESANAGVVTIRQLLQHRSGLPNPDPAAERESLVPPVFYRDDFEGSRDPLSGFCAGQVTAPPGGAWEYNNCDYMVLGAVLEAVTGKTWQDLFAERIAEPLGLEFAAVYPSEPFTRWGVINGEREAQRNLAAYGASGALYGSAEDLVAIDMALLSDKLLTREAREEMWQGDPALGYMALGQWVFPASLSGCEEPVRIVERRGGIGAVEVRNFILPEKGMAVAAFSQQAPFDFGEIWTGKGFAFELLSAVACGGIE